MTETKKTETKKQKQDNIAFCDIKGSCFEKYEQEATFSKNSTCQIDKNGHSILQKKLPKDLIFPYVLNKEIKELNTSEFEGSYTVLIFYPYDFTFVCPVEIRNISKRKEEFEKLNAQVFFVSTDSPFSHLRWNSMSEEEKGVPNLNFPLVSDFKKELCSFFNLKNLEGHSERATVFLDKEMKVRSFIVSDPRISRSDDECLRVLKGLNFVDENQNAFFFENKFN